MCNKQSGAMSIASSCINGEGWWIDRTEQRFSSQVNNCV